MEIEDFNLEDLYYWMNLHNFVFPKKLLVVLEQHVAVFNGFMIKMTKAEDELQKRMIKLVLDQYPVIKKQGDQLAEIDARCCWVDAQLFIEFFVNKLIEEGPFDQKTKNILKDISKGRRKSPLLSYPNLLKETDRPYNSHLSKAQWKSKCSKHNQKALREYKYHKRRMDEFLKLTWLVLMKHFPEIKNFSSDQKRDYDNFMQERYRVYRFSCEQQQLVLDYDMDGSFIHKSKKELAQIISKLSPAKRAEVNDIHKRRLLGEKI